MDRYISVAAVHDLGYEALDAVVADIVENIVLATAEGEQVPLTMQWMALSAGSSQFRVTDPSGREVVRLRVRLLPEKDRIVSVVNFQTQVPEFEGLLHQLAAGVRGAIAQHRENLKTLEEHGVYTPASPPRTEVTLPHIPDFPDLEEAGWDAIFAWYYAYGLPILHIPLTTIAQRTGKGYRTVQRHKEAYDAEHGTSTRKRRKDGA